MRLLFRLWKARRYIALIERESRATMKTIRAVRRQHLDLALTVSRAQKMMATHMTSWQDEIARMEQAAAEDARLLLAYARWCEKNGCVPSRADLDAVVSE